MFPFIWFHPNLHEATAIYHHLSVPILVHYPRVYMYANGPISGLPSREEGGQEGLIQKSCRQLWYKLQPLTITDGLSTLLAFCVTQPPLTSTHRIYVMWNFVMFTLFSAWANSWKHLSWHVCNDNIAINIGPFNPGIKVSMTDTVAIKRFPISKATDTN